jgi:hypothetical protein
MRDERGEICTARAPDEDHYHYIRARSIDVYLQQNLHHPLYLPQQLLM